MLVFTILRQRDVELRLRSDVGVLGQDLADGEIAWELRGRVRVGEVRAPKSDGNVIGRSGVGQEDAVQRRVTSGTVVE